MKNIAKSFDRPSEGLQQVLPFRVVEKKGGKKGEFFSGTVSMVRDACHVVGANFKLRHHKAGAPRGLQFRHPTEAPGAAL